MSQESALPQPVKSVAKDKVIKQSAERGTMGPLYPTPTKVSITVYWIGANRYLRTIPRFCQSALLPSTESASVPKTPQPVRQRNLGRLPAQLPCFCLASARAMLRCSRKRTFSARSWSGESS